MNEFIINVKGIECGGCENRIKNALKAIDGVEKVEASHETGIVKVLANEKAEKDEIENTINDLGFDVLNK